MSQRKTKEFKDLQTKWYKKLEQSGFKDAEQDDGHLKVWHSHFFKVRWNSDKFHAKEDYYRLTAQFLHDYTFANDRERTIWQLHSEGKSIRSIVKTLKDQGYKASKDSVHLVIKQISQEMIIKCRSQKQT